MSKHTGMSMGGSIEYTRRRSPKGKNCSKCSNLYNGYCKGHNIRISDNTNAKLCKLYKEKKKNNVQKDYAKSIV